MNWRDTFIQCAYTDMSRGFDLRQTFNQLISKEDLYQDFKARLLSEVVAKETITYFGDIVGTKVYELGEKE